MSKIVENMILAQAAQLELEAAMKSLEAATLRHDAKGATEARNRAHDVLDSILDLKAGAMVEALKAGGK